MSLQNIIYNFKEFFRKFWKIIVLLAFVILLIALVIKGITTVQKFLTTQSSTTPGTSGIVTIDGNGVNLQDSQELAESYKVQIEAGTNELSVNTNNVEVNASLNSIPLQLKKEKKRILLDSTNIGNGSTIIFTIITGGDGSWVSQRVGPDIKHYYLAVQVNNPNSDQTTTTDGIISGKVFFDESMFLTYSTEEAAQSAIEGKENTFTLPTKSLDGIQIRAEPTEGTARIFVIPSMVDNTGIDGTSIRLDQYNNWTSTLNIKEFAGHQLTLMLKAEDGMAFTTSFQYVSFWVP